MLKGDLLTRAFKVDAPAPIPSSERLSVLPEILFARKFYASPRDEDTKPIAEKIDTDNTFMLIADGMGGSAATQVIDKGKSESEAHVVAQHMHASFDDLLKYQPHIISNAKNAADLALILEREVLNPLFPKLEATYGRTRTSNLSGNVIKPFATTLSAAHIQSGRDTTIVNCAWGGDSPIFIFTPQHIYTTYTEGMGDVGMDDGLSLKKHKLKSGQIILPKDEPFVVINSTDWILKQLADELGAALSIIENSLDDNQDQWASNLFAMWRKHTGMGGEMDDATIALYARGKLPQFPKQASLTSIEI